MCPQSVRDQGKKNTILRCPPLYVQYNGLDENKAGDDHRNAADTHDDSEDDGHN